MATTPALYSTERNILILFYQSQLLPTLPPSHDSQIARIKTFLSISNAVGRKETLTEMPLVLNTTATGENEIDDSKKSIEHETFRRMG